MSELRTTPFFHFFLHQRNVSLTRSLILTEQEKLSRRYRNVINIETFYIVSKHENKNASFMKKGGVWG